MKIKRLYGILLSLVIWFGLALGFSVTAYAAINDYPLWVGGVQVTSENAGDIFHDGKAMFNTETATLTLNGYSYSGEGYGDAAIYIGDFGGKDFKLCVSGTSSLESTATYGYAIRSVGAGKVSVEGTGIDPTLKLTVPSTYDTGYAVSVKGKEATFKDLSMQITGYLGIVVNGTNTVGDALLIDNCAITFGGTGIDQAIWVYNKGGDGSISVKNGSKLSGKGAILCYGYGTESGDANVLIENSTVNLTGCTTAPVALQASRHAIEVLSKCGDSTLTIDGSIVNVTASNGVSANGNGADGINVGTQETANGKGAAKVEIKNNSTVTATGCANGLNVFTWGKLTVNPHGTTIVVADSTLTASATDDDDGAYGIVAYAYKKGSTTVTFTNSNITASAKKTAGICLGAGEDDNDQVGDLTLNSLNSTIITSGPYGLNVSAETEGGNHDASQTVSVTGGSFSSTGGVFVLGDDFDNSTLSFNNTEITVDIQSNVDVTEAVVAGNLTINGGFYKFIYDADSSQTAIDAITCSISGGKFSDEPEENQIIEGFAVFENTDSDSGEYPYVVLPAVKVTFNANDGAASPATEEQPVKKGIATKLQANSFKNGARVFNGWNTDAGGNGTSYAEEAEVTLNEDLVLYACWNSIPAVITANIRTYDGTEQPLISVSGEPSEGVLYFALGSDADTAPIDDWVTSSPTGIAAGTYYVWYKVVDSVSNLVDPTFLFEVTIAKKDAAALTITTGETVFHYDGQKHVPAITVSDGTTPLSTQADYTITYYKKNDTDGSWETVDEDDITLLGTYKAVLTFVNYEAKDGGEVSVEFIITAPEVAGHSLVLSGYIGVNFYLSLPDYPGFGYGGSSMTFTINGKMETVPLANAVKVDGLYRFTCEINAIQMADDIKAVFNYTWNGETRTLEDKKEGVYDAYSARQYILESETVELSPKTRALVHALADYGHYVQLYLDDYHGEWRLVDAYTADSDSSQHKKMDWYYSSYSSADLNTVKNKVANMGISIRRSSKIARVSYSLSLDSGTSLNLYFTPATGYTGGAAATVNGASAAYTVDEEGRFKVSVTDIPAYKLGTAYTVVLKTGNVSTTVKVSGLSFVRDVLSGTDEKAQKAVAALYKYYAAAVAYKS